MTALPPPPHACKSRNLARKFNCAGLPQGFRDSFEQRKEATAFRKSLVWFGCASLMGAQNMSANGLPPGRPARGEGQKVKKVAPTRHPTQDSLERFATLVSAGKLRMAHRPLVGCSGTVAHTQAQTAGSRKLNTAH